MQNNIYTVKDLKSVVAPIAEKHGVERVFLFGSYARGNPSMDSDIDLRIDKGKLKGMFALGALYSELASRLNKPLDLLTTGSLDDAFLQSIKNEEVLLYERSKA